MIVRLVETIGLGVLLSCAAFSQSAAAPPAFEVASVRPSIAASRPGAVQPRDWGDVTGKVTLQHIPLRYVLLHAYGLQAAQLSGPTWLESEFFDILAIVPANSPKEQIPQMFQALLTERFRLRFHRETRSAPFYALVVGEGASRLKTALPADTSGSTIGTKLTLGGNGEDKPMSAISTGRFGRFRMTMAKGILHYEFAEMTLKALAEFLSQGVVDLPVVDMTALRGSYQISLDIPVNQVLTTTSGSPVELGGAQQPSLTAPDPSGTSLRASLDKLGLRLIRRSGQTEKFVIDHIEKTPTQN